MLGAGRGAAQVVIEDVDEILVLRGSIYIFGGRADRGGFSCIEPGNEDVCDELIEAMVCGKAATGQVCKRCRTRDVDREN